MYEQDWVPGQRDYAALCSRAEQVTSELNVLPSVQKEGSDFAVVGPAWEGMSCHISAILMLFSSLAHNHREAFNAVFTGAQGAVMVAANNARVRGACPTLIMRLVRSSLNGKPNSKVGEDSGAVLQGAGAYPFPFSAEAAVLKIISPAPQGEDFVDPSTVQIRSSGCRPGCICGIRKPVITTHTTSAIPIKSQHRSCTAAIQEALTEKTCQNCDRCDPVLRLPRDDKGNLLNPPPVQKHYTYETTPQDTTPQILMFEASAGLPPDFELNMSILFSGEPYALVGLTCFKAPTLLAPIGHCNTVASVNGTFRLFDNPKSACGTGCTFTTSTHVATDNTTGAPRLTNLARQGFIARNLLYARKETSVETRGAPDQPGVGAAPAHEGTMMSLSRPTHVLSLTPTPPPSPTLTTQARSSGTCSRASLVTAPLLHTTKARSLPRACLRVSTSYILKMSWAFFAQRSRMMMHPLLGCLLWYWA